MKKLILLFCFIFAAAQGYSQFAEDFSYTATQNITANTWTAIDAAGTNPIKVTSGGLTFTDYIGSGVGNAAALQSLGGEDDAKDIIPTQTSGNVYASFMLNVTSIAGTTGGYFFALRSSGNSHNGRIYAQANGGGYNIGIGNAGSPAVTPVYLGTLYSFNTTYLVIVKYTFNAGVGDDLLSLWVYSVPPPASEPAADFGPIHMTNMTDATNISSILLRQGTNGNSPALVIDGIYVRNTWDNGVLPVELSSFTSTINNRDVTLNWTTQTEINNSGFEIERAVNGVWTNAGFVAGNGNTTLSHSYSFTDRSLNIGTYSYRLKQIDYNGAFEYHNLTNEVIIGAPSTYSLSQNYPNPFNPSTVINYQLPKAGDVNITVYDLSGKEVKSLVNGKQEAGFYSVSLNASSLSSGVYFYTIRTNDFTNTKSMLLVK